MLELLLNTVRARACYSTRVWTALSFPVFIGTVFGSSTRWKLEALLISVAVVVAYTAAALIEKKYLR
ncbi:MAG: hypothetical protein WDO68_01885 [Gammaproteobacteria bacterium]